VLGRPLGAHLLTAGPIRWQPAGGADPKNADKVRP
jgi:hypothetical protein